MTTAAVSSVVNKLVTPQLGIGCAVITYSKANVADTLNVATLLPAATSIVAARATVDAAGADDPCTFSGTTITFTTGTGAGRAIVFYA